MGRIAFTQREPIGVVVAVSAFNHPLNLIVHQVGPAIAAGCPVIVKPAEDTPLAAKMKQHGTRVWLVNTGWSEGSYGTGKRIKLANTRAIIDAIHSGALAKAETHRDPVFGFDVVTECPNVPDRHTDSPQCLGRQSGL
jgi:hypothetical protein